MAASSQEMFCYLSMKSTSYFSSVVSNLCPTVGIELHSTLKWKNCGGLSLCYFLNLFGFIWGLPALRRTAQLSRTVWGASRATAQLVSAVIVMFQRCLRSPDSCPLTVSLLNYCRLRRIRSNQGRHIVQGAKNHHKCTFFWGMILSLYFPFCHCKRQMERRLLKLFAGADQKVISVAFQPGFVINKWLQNYRAFAIVGIGKRQKILLYLHSFIHLWSELMWYRLGKSEP